MKIKRCKIYDIPMRECYVDLYDHYFYVFFGEKNREKFADALQDGELKVFSKGAYGAVFMVDNEYHPKCIYLWFPNNNWDLVERGTLAHEIIHVIDMISKIKGFHHDVDNQEVYAQFMGYMFRNLLPLFKDK